ncbi:MAG: LexA family transcriptional regulator [Candidatus Nitrohelix vancouverensis]|uniref:LexA family transcriptional regulator n=1 Tax=Candidatus Nitrohelix vancouverensis TaxID=2705534 RepID=A0A7T0G2U0_9BACT|nr:MAG: LexA family transcriptional regulator [Candidatus Nitrohelix vancouverensis]
MSENSDQPVLKRIELLRGSLSLKGFCERCDISYTALQKSVVRGKVPNLDILEKIAKKEGVNLQWLISGPQALSTLSATLNRNLVALRRQRGWSQSELAEKAGLGAVSLKLLEEGAWPLSIDELATLSEALGAPPQTFLLDDMQVAPATELKILKSSSSAKAPKIKDEDYVSIPLTSSAIAAGQPIIQEDQIEDYVLLHVRAAGRRGNLVASRVEGVSMEPMLHSGDIVVIDRNQKTIQKNRIFAIYHQDGLTAKYLEMQKNLLVLRPINPMSQVQIINLDEQPDPIVGRIIGAWKEL